MAPEARGLGVSLFALCLFTGQSAGVAIGAPIVDGFGVRPVYAGAAIALPMIAIWFTSRFAVRPK
jgi:predicted MFS family arabinose efflux permease